MGLGEGIIASAVRGVLRELAINPRDVRLICVLDDGEHLLARMDGLTLHQLLARASKKRVLRLKLGNVLYDFSLGPKGESRGKRRVVGAPRQRGDED